MKFLARESELGALVSQYTSGESNFIPIYGRRRVGKSSLILEFIKDKPSLYYLGKQAPATLQQKEILTLCAERFQEPLLAEIAPESWRQVLELIDDRVQSAGNKFVLVFDEFQWMVGDSPELPSLLQEFWDTRWSESGNLFLILCGSFIGFMEREVLGNKSPLFGRRTGQIHLRPFPFWEAAAFHPNESAPNLARIFFICGGVPQYLKRFAPRFSVEESIRREILDEFSPLSREPDFLLREELRELPKYYAILTQLARGSANAKMIAKAAGVPERSIPYYLNQLVELGYVRKRFPVKAKPSPRQVRYQLHDPLLRFWFRFVYPNQSLIRQLEPKDAYQQLIAPRLEQYFGECFETLCQEWLRRRYAKEFIAGFEVGEYWDKKVQIDVVGLRQDNRTDIGECKWGKIESAPKLAAELKRKCELYPNDRAATLGRILFVQQLKGRISNEIEIVSVEKIYSR